MPATNPNGLRRHEYFAGCALQGLLASATENEDAGLLAIKVLEYANALEHHFKEVDKARMARLAQGKDEATGGPYNTTGG